MKKAVKKVIVYSLLVGLTQFGLNASILEASPRNDNHQGRQEQQHFQRHERQENERHYRENMENERHEREMQRRENEEWQDWNDRQYLENLSHNQIIAQIAQDVVLLFLGE